MNSSSVSNRGVLIGVRLEEPLVRDLDRYAYEHQVPRARKLGRASIVRLALITFLNDQAQEQVLKNAAKAAAKGIQPHLP